MLQLYYSPGACSLAVHIALVATDAEYQLVDSKIIDGKTRTEEFLKLNDRARVPVLVKGGQVYREAVALLISLDDWFPEAALLPPHGSDARHHCLEWMLFCTSTLHPLYWGLWRKHRLVSEEAHHVDLEATSRLELLKAYGRLEQQLQGRQFLLGDQPWACDYYAFVFVRWAYRVFKQIPQFPRLEVYYKTLSNLSVVKKALADEGLL
jgi:glutathione S-transferase